jgi:hypothetical protein
MKARNSQGANRESRRTSLLLQQLEDRVVLNGLSLLANWDNGTAKYSDGWADDRGDRQIAYMGHYQNNNGMHLIDVTDPANPFLVSTFKSNTSYNDFRDVETTKIGNRWIGLFSSDSGGGLFVVDVTDPANPVQLYQIKQSHGGHTSVHTLSVWGKYLFEADSRSDTIRVFDIGVPEQPTFIRTIKSQTTDVVHEVTVLNGRMYTANIWGSGSAEIWDVSQISQTGAPVTYLGVAFPGYMSHTSWPSRDGRYMANAREGKAGELNFYDIQNPASPQKLWSIRTQVSDAWCVHQVTIHGNLVFAAWYQEGIKVFDISDRSNPVLVGSYDTFDGEINQSWPYQGAWGVYPYLGRDKILVFDMYTGMYTFSFHPGRSTTETLREVAPGEFVLEASPKNTAKAPSINLSDVMSNAPTAELVNGVVRIIGHESGTNVVVRRNVAGQTIDVMIDAAAAYSFPLAQVSQINAYGGAGDDTFDFGTALDIPVYVDGGGGFNVARGLPQTFDLARKHDALARQSGGPVHGLRGAPSTVVRVQDARLDQSAPQQLTPTTTHGIHSAGAANAPMSASTFHSAMTITSMQSAAFWGMDPSLMRAGGEMMAMHGGKISPELMVRTSVNNQVGGQVAYHKPG